MARSEKSNIIKQAAWATPLTPTKSFPLIDTIAVVRNPTIVRSQRVRVNTGGNEGRKVAGEFYQLTMKGELDAKHNTFFIESILGKVTTSADTPEAGAYTHAYKLSETQADLDQLFKIGYTLEYGQGGKWYTAGSCVTVSWTIDEVTAAGIPTVTIVLLARTLTEAGAEAGTYSVETPSFVMDTAQLVLSYGVDASEVTQDFLGFGLTIQRNDIAPFNTLNDITGAKQWFYGETDIMGSFTIEVGDTKRTAIKDDLDNLDVASALLVFTSKELIIGTTYNKITIDIPEVQLENADKSTDRQLDFEKYNFIAGISTGADVDIITVSAINDSATAY